MSAFQLLTPSHRLVSIWFRSDADDVQKVDESIRHGLPCFAGLPFPSMDGLYFPKQPAIWTAPLTFDTAIDRCLEEARVIA
jgi:hypothetical protein